MIFKTLAAVTLVMAFVQAPAAIGAQDPAPAGAQSPSAAPAVPRAAVPAQAAGTSASPPSGRSVQEPAPRSAQPSVTPSDANSCPGGNCDLWPTTVKVANAPPAAPFWPLHDRILWGALIVLVILGYVAILLAVSTLKKIERNTKSGEEAAAAAYDAARAALVHSQALVRNERPWILVSIEPSPGVANGFTITASNRGRTPARIVAMPHKIQFAEDESHLPEVPQYQDSTAAPPFVPIVLLPGEFAQVTSFCRDQVRQLCESDEQFTRVENWEEKIFLYGRLTYRDLVSPQDEQIHQSSWCFWYIHGHQNSGMVPAGSSNYNMHT